MGMINFWLVRIPWASPSCCKMLITDPSLPCRVQKKTFWWKIHEESFLIICNVANISQIEPLPPDQQQTRTTKRLWRFARLTWGFTHTSSPTFHSCRSARHILRSRALTENFRFNFSSPTDLWNSTPIVYVKANKSWKSSHSKNKVSWSKLIMLPKP